MIFSRYLDERKEYDPDHVCLTPGAIYSTTMHEKSIAVNVTLPSGIELPDDPAKAKELEVDIHYAIEKVLARIFGKKE